MQLLIECTTEEQDVLLHDFCLFTCDRLEIDNPPSFTFVEHTGATSFGSYQPSEESIIVATEGRHISDILRTLGHELVHHKQLSEGENAMSLEELEYEANAVAGMLMRDYNKLHPEMFGLGAPVDVPPGSIGDSQGATSPDTTRPSGPIEFAEEMTAGGGDVAGIGIGPQGEPGVSKKKKSPILQPMLKRFKQLREEIQIHSSFSGDDVKIHVPKKTKYPPTEYGMTTKEKAEKAAAAKEKRAHDEYSLNYPFNELKYRAPGSGPGKGKGARSGHHNNLSAMREEFKDPAIEARKKLATGKIPATAKELLARRKLVAQINAPKKK